MRRMGRDIGDVIEARLRAELRPGETPLWAAASEAPRMSSGLIVAGVICATCWLLGFSALSASTMGWLRPNPGAVSVFTILGVLSCVVGFFTLLGLIGMTVHRFLIVRRPAPRASYALTDQRAIFWHTEVGESGVTVSSLGWDQVAHVRRVEHLDQTCDLVFTPAFSNYTGPTSFPHIRDARAGEEVARERMANR